MPAGRPSKYLPATVKKITDALSAGNTRRAAAAYGGISETTLGAWIANFRDFREAVKSAEAQAEVGHVANIAQAARNGTWQASAWWLERRYPDAWGKRDRLEVVSTVRQLAREHNLTAEEEADAVAEALRLVQEHQRASGR